MITKEQRAEAYKRAPENIIEICSSLETGALLMKLAQKYAVAYDYIDIVGDVLVGLRSQDTFDQDLTTELKIPATVAQSLSNDLRSLFNKALSGVTVPDAHIDAKEKLELRPQVPPPSGGTAPVYGTATPLPQAPRSSVPPPPTPRPAAPQSALGVTPGAPGQSRPLTREELMNALGAKRTMASDMERARGGGAPMVPPPSYGTAPKPPTPPPPPPSSNH